jgi:hypothetical protein
MKKRVQKEPMLNTLARKVGRAAGTIAKAAQELAGDAAAIVQADVAKPPKARKKTARASKRRALPKGKKKIAKSVTRKSRTRTRTH